MKVVRAAQHGHERLQRGGSAREEEMDGGRKGGDRWRAGIVS
jgi:hypothetical protein